MVGIALTNMYGSKVFLAKESLMTPIHLIRIFILIILIAGMSK